MKNSLYFFSFKAPKNNVNAQLGKPCFISLFGDPPSSSTPGPSLHLDLNLELFWSKYSKFKMEVLWIATDTYNNFGYYSMTHKKGESFLVLLALALQQVRRGK